MGLSCRSNVKRVSSPNVGASNVLLDVLGGDDTEDGAVLEGNFFGKLEEDKTLRNGHINIISRMECGCSLGIL